MKLVKTVVLTGLQSVVRIASSLVLNKIIAVYVGPSGYAVMGQFQNLIALMTSLAGGVISTGVTKATAAHYDDEARQHLVWQTAIRFSLWGSLAAGIGLFIFRDWLAQRVLNQAGMFDVFIWLAITLPILTLNNILLAIVNGKKETRIYVVSNIIGGLLVVGMIIAMTMAFGLHGILISYTVGPALVLMTTAMFVTRTRWFSFKQLWGKIDLPEMRELAGFGAMGLLSALIIPFSLIVIRDHLVTKLGMNVAGYWQATWKISEIYLTLVTGALAVYYLPRLAEIRTSRELKTEIFNVYRLILPIVTAGALLIYFLRDVIIHILLTKEFVPMHDLFFWQLVGDVLKIGAWILAYVMVGRAMAKTYLISELMLWVTFMALARWGIDSIGVQGVTMAYAATYGLFWIAMVFLVRHEMRRMDKNHLVMQAEALGDET
jgi:PST family polysaccharide transporter